MKRHIKLNQWIVLLLTFLAVAFAACSDDDESDSGQVVLEVYGPSPALRGSDLTFIGRNMNQVTAVVLPENIEITDIEVVSSEKIKITIPQDAAEGYVKLQTPNGVVTSKTLLSYIEPVSISKISPNPVKAGETLTIEGDYLNLMQKVVFADNVTVMAKDFTTWKRSMIELVVPKEAQTGSIILADTATIPVELESEAILQVTLPSVASVTELANKKPGDVITMSGADLDLVEYVVLANKDSINFTVDNTTLSFTLPSGTTDGEINMLAFSGIKVPVANVTMAVPTELTADPATELRGGDVITVAGEDMDLVTTVVFPGVDDAVTPESIAADKITVIMPDAAISGTLVLNTASGNTATIAISTQKSAVESYSPSPVSAGNEVTLAGTNLDLVTSVTFAGGLTVNVAPSSAASLTLTVPVDAETGVVTLTMANGETVDAPSLTVDKPEFCYIPELPGADTEINAGTILEVDVKNEDQLTGVQVDGNATQYILQGTTLYVLIPNDAGGETDLTLLSANGNVSYTIQVVGSGTTETVIMDEMHDLGSWTGEADGGAFRLYKSSFMDVPAGSTLKFYFTVTGTGQMQINDANWAEQAIPEFTDETQTSYDMELTQDFLDHILNTSDGWSETALIIQGQNLIISKVSIITSGSSTETLWQGEQAMGNWAASVQLSSGLFANVKVGRTLILSVTQGDVAAQYGIRDSGWVNYIDYADIPSGATNIEVPVDQALLDMMNAGGLIITGHDYSLTKVEIE